MSNLRIDIQLARDVITLAYQRHQDRFLDDPRVARACTVLGLTPELALAYAPAWVRELGVAPPPPAKAIVPDSLFT